jgi:O-antigen/teichoic acid export membrane protein
LEAPSALSKQIVRGSLWAFAIRITGRLLGFIRTIVLARLLVPEDFGLLGIAILAVNVLETFSYTGFQSALIQKRDNIETYFDTAWTVSASRGLFLFLILLVSAPALASFFNSPNAVLIIQIVATASLITGLRNVGIISFQKNLEFHKQFKFELPPNLVDLIVSVSLAFILRDVWALVWGGMAGNLSRLFLSYYLHPYRPRLKFDKSQFKELFGFGKWVLGSSILIFLITQGDNVFVGKMLGVALLGLYQMAFLLAYLPSSEISYVISQVIFPAYSRLQDDMPALREGYLRVLQITLFLSAIISALIFALAPDFTAIFLGEKWMPMVPAMQILVLAAFLTSITETSALVFIAVGKPKIETIFQVTRFVVLAIFIYPLSLQWGIAGTSAAVLLSIAVSCIGLTFMTIRITDTGITRFVRRSAIPAINGLAAASAIFLLKVYLEPGILSFLVTGSAGVVTYLLLTLLADRIFDYKMWPIAQETLGSIRGS